MSIGSHGRRRAVVQITLERAARLHRLVSALSETPLDREAILKSLGVGLRTFYRELETLSKCGIKLRRDKREYSLKTPMEEVRERLPFPNPHLSFAEIAELSRHSGPAAKRLAQLLERVLDLPAPARTSPSRKRRKS